MQCTAQRQQKAANTSLWESRNLLQTATLVFPRSIVCSRLSNNINILAKKFFQAANGGGMAPAPLNPPLSIIFDISRPTCSVMTTCYDVCCSYQGGRELTSPIVSHRHHGVHDRSVCCRPTPDVVCVPAMSTHTCRLHLSIKHFELRWSEVEHRGHTQQAKPTSSLAVFERQCRATHQLHAVSQPTDYES